MAIDLLKKIEAPRGLFAVEKVTLIYNLLTAFVIILLFPRMAQPWPMLCERAMIVGMTFGLMYLYRIHPCRLTTYIRVLVQLGLLSYWYPDTYELNRHFPNLDHLFSGVEQALFGGQPALLFSEHFPSKWVSECVNLGYFSYYPMMLAVGTYYFLRRFDLFEKWSFVLAASFYIYYLIYVFVPVAGPQFYFPVIGYDSAASGVFPAVGHYFNLHPELYPGLYDQPGFFHSLVEHSQSIGERPTAAFPSSHVGISTILMIMSARVSRNLFCFLLPFYLLLCLATVYIQAHYLIDVIVGFVSAFLVYALCSFMYRRWFATPYFK